MAALTGGEMCIKYLMFAFNFVFWVGVKNWRVLHRALTSTPLNTFGMNWNWNWNWNWSLLHIPTSAVDLTNALVAE